MSGTRTFTYTRAHTAVYVADNMRNLLRDLISWSGLNPAKLVDDWVNLGKAVQTWLESGHLQSITIEFFEPGSDGLLTRWDFPISYGGSGVDDDMWVDKLLVQQTIAKAPKPPANASYRVLLEAPSSSRPFVPNMVDTSFRSTEGLTCRNSGTSMATPDIMAGINYWKKP